MYVSKECTYLKNSTLWVVEHHFEKNSENYLRKTTWRISWVYGKLHTCLASSVSIERIFLSFGPVRTKVGNRMVSDKAQNLLKLYRYYIRNSRVNIWRTLGRDYKIPNKVAIPTENTNGMIHWYEVK